MIPMCETRVQDGEKDVGQCNGDENGAKNRLEPVPKGEWIHFAAVLPRVHK